MAWRRGYGLGGFVRNDADGVLLEVEGVRYGHFVAALRRELPPLARLDAIEIEAIAPRGDEDFVIEATRAGAARARAFPPMPRPANIASTICSIRRAAFISIPSSTAPIAARATR